MILTKLKITSFGKLKNLEINFNEGLNVIYGANEAGKSTIQTFIKAMLYGMNSRKQDIRENDRKRYLPWDGDRASGELYFLDDDNNEYVIRKTFGSTKAYDRQEIINVITGKAANHINSNMPGFNILGIGEEAFERSIFIRQLGCEVSKNKKDEIMNKLTNLHQSGDENVSYTNALNKLQELRKKYTTPRGVGKLDCLLEEYSSLKQERTSTLALHEENLNDQLEVKKKEKQISKIKIEITELEKQKNRLREYKKYKEYTNISSYHSQLEELLRQLQEAENDLQYDDVMIDEAYIDNLKKLKNEWINLGSRLNEIKEFNNDLKKQLDQNQEKLKDFEGFEKFEEQIELKIYEANKKIENLTNKIKERNSVKKELDELQNKLKNEREKLGSLNQFEEVNEELENEIENNEQVINDLKQKLDVNAKLDNLELRRDILIEKKNTNQLITYGGLALVVGGLVGGIFSIFIFIIALMGLLLAGFGFSRKNKIAKDLEKIEDEINLAKSDNKIQQEINRLQERLREIYSKLGVEGYQDFRSKMRKYNSHRTEIELLKNKIKEKESFLDKEDHAELENQLKLSTDYIQSTLKVSKSNDIDEFNRKLRKFKSYISERNNLEKEISNYEDQMANIDSKVKAKEVEIFTEFEKINRGNINLVKIEEEIKNLTNKLSNKNEINSKYNSVKNTYEELLKDRDIETIKEYINSISFTEDEEILFSKMDEQTLDYNINSKTQELLTFEKELRDIQNRINNRFYNKMTLEKIDECLNNMEEQIKLYKDKVKVIDIAIDNIKKSFEEIQKSFGPKLNKEVGNILNEITLGKYSDIKISEEYDIRVVEPLTGSDMEVGYFSNGTWDQIYFAVRLGIVNLIFEDPKSVPIILDDTFIQYDDMRLNAVMKYIYNYSKKKQCILFTCKSSEVNCVKSYSDVNIIDLNKVSNN